MNSKLNELVRALINLSDLSGKDVAQSADLTPSMVSRFLNGKTDIKSESLLKLLKSLEVDLPAVLRRELLNRINGRRPSASFDDDLLVVFHHMNEIDQKTVLNIMVAALSLTAGAEANEAAKRLTQQANKLAMRKRRFA